MVGASEYNRYVWRLKVGGASSVISVVKRRRKTVMGRWRNSET